MTVPNARTMLIMRARLVAIVISCTRLQLINEGVVLERGPLSREIVHSFFFIRTSKNWVSLKSS